MLKYKYFIFIWMLFTSLVCLPEVDAQATKSASKVLRLIEKWGRKANKSELEKYSKELEIYAKKGFDKSGKIKSKGGKIEIPKSYPRWPKTTPPSQNESFGDSTLIFNISWQSPHGLFHTGSIFRFNEKLVFRVNFQNNMGGITSVDQPMFIGNHPNCTVLLIGYNPVYSNTNTQVPTYSPDSFCFQQISEDFLNVITCDQKSCSQVYLQ